VPLSCVFLALLSHPSHQITRVDSVSLVISLVEPAMIRCRTRPRGSTHDWLNTLPRPSSLRLGAPGRR
jgi:hypothetical protein